MQAAGNQPKVAVTIYPLYEWTRAVAAEHAEVFALVPPGANAHLYAPRPWDLVQLSRCRVFFYLRDDMEPWASDLAAQAKSSDLLVIALGKGLAESLADPHVWLDPLLAVQMVKKIAEVLGHVDPGHAGTYEKNAIEYVIRLRDLDNYIRHKVADCPTRRIFYAGPYPFAHFARRYGIEFRRLYRSSSEEAQISARDMARMIGEVKQVPNPVICYAELFDPRAARALAAETGARLVALHGLHNLAPDELERGLTYIDLMKRNADRLSEALGCR